VIYGVSIFEHLETDSASRLARNCHTLLASGGILLAGSVTPKVPTSEQILRAWLTDWDLKYRDEATWRHVFARSGFDTTALRFEYERHRANVIVIAERDGRK
jgi:predicted SAM-dependent methyltransferase